MKLATWGFVTLLLTPAGIVLARRQSDQPQQEDSLAAAAHHTREQKKQEAKAEKVWTNDDIPKGGGSLSVVGHSGTGNSTTPADSSANAANGGNEPVSSVAAAGKNGTSADKRVSMEADLASAKDNLQSLQNDVDVLQRKFTLDQQMYYGRPDYSSDKAGATALKDEQDRIDAKQQEISDAQKKIADLEAQLTSVNPDTSNTAK